MADLIFAEEVRQYLIDEGAVSAVEDGQMNPPPCEIDPVDGAMNVQIPPGADKAVCIVTGIEIVNPYLLAEFLQDFPLEFIVRAKTRPECALMQRVIRGLMVDKINIQMGQLLIEKSVHFRGEQKIAEDQESVTTSQSFRVSARVANLTV